MEDDEAPPLLVEVESDAVLSAEGIETAVDDMAITKVPITIVTGT